MITINHADNPPMTFHQIIKGAAGDYCRSWIRNGAPQFNPRREDYFSIPIKNKGKYAGRITSGFNADEFYTVQECPVCSVRETQKSQRHGELSQSVTGGRVYNVRNREMRGRVYKGNPGVIHQPAKRRVQEAGY